MNKNKMLFISLLLLMFATYSCAVEELQPDPSLFSSEILKNVNPAFLEHNLSAYKIKPIWSSFITFNNLEAVEVNFTINKKNKFPYQKTVKFEDDKDYCLHLKTDKLAKQL